MELILDRQKTGGRRKGRLQARFDKLHSALERQRRCNARFTQHIDELVDIYHRRSIENDRAVFDDLLALSEKLITFAGRKSLSDWHRIDLDEWLRDLIERRIAPVDLQVADRLRLDYRQAITRGMGLSVEDLVERFGFRNEHIDHESGEQRRAHSTQDGDHDPWQEDLFGFDDVGTEEEPFDTGFDAREGDRTENEATARISRSVMDGSWAKDLFRRAAQTLHPDREPDPERRKAKEERLRELLQARKQGDILAMLTIYSSSVADADIVLAERDMAEICDALEQQFDALESEMKQYIYTHPVRHMVFELFYHSTKKGRQQRLREWEQDLRQEASELRALVPSLRNLSSLKNVLKDRRDARASAFANALLHDVLFDDD